MKVPTHITKRTTILKYVTISRGHKQSLLFVSGWAAQFKRIDEIAPDFGGKTVVWNANAHVCGGKTWEGVEAGMNVPWITSVYHRHHTAL